jgi:hypothetical protein
MLAAVMIAPLRLPRSRRDAVDYDTLFDLAARA